MTPETPSEHFPILIVGAGISGLLAATVLKRAGHTVVLVDKSAGVGGRMATRRIGDAVFDHGAQYFTVRTEGFQRFVDEWLEAGVVREWFRRFPEESTEAGHPRYIGVGGMTAAPKHLANDLEVRRRHAVTRAERRGDCWEVFFQHQPRIRCDYLVLTAPVPQALNLIDAGGISLRENDARVLRGMTYRRSVTAMVQFSEPSRLGEIGCKKFNHPVISTVTDNYTKGISPVPGAVTIHSSYGFGSRHWDTGPEEWVPVLIEAVRDLVSGEVVEYQGHRWRYNILDNPTEDTVFFNRNLHLVMGGDGFGGPRVEGSALSGIACAEKLLEIL